MKTQRNSCPSVLFGGVFEAPLCTFEGLHNPAKRRLDAAELLADVQQSAMSRPHFSAALGYQYESKSKLKENLKFNWPNLTNFDSKEITSYKDV